MKKISNELNSKIVFGVRKGRDQTRNELCQKAHESPSFLDRSLRTTVTAVKFVWFVICFAAAIVMVCVTVCEYITRLVWQCSNFCYSAPSLAYLMCPI